MRAIIQKTAKNLLASTVTFAIILTCALIVGASFGAQIIPAVHILYDATSVSWLSMTRSAIHLILSVTMLLMGSIMFSSGQMKRTTLRVRAYVIGMFLQSAAVLNFTVLGLVLWGGSWHWASFVAGAFCAVCSTVCVITMFFTQEENDKT